MSPARILPASDAASLEAAVALLRRGQVVAFPTDTVYGVGANAFDGAAVARLYEAKGRSQEKSIPVLLASFDDLSLVAGELSPAAWKLAHTFWPGGLTLVVARRPELPEEVSSTDSVAVRIPDHPVTLELIRAAGFPLATTSANLSGRPSTVTAQQVADALGERIPCILDGGTTPGGIASSVVDCSVTPPRVLRQGALAIELLRAVVPELA